ncbi:MAG: histidine kinase [Gammaproteobacteria bacterium]|nr:histidine kinase [Gammaproteobacteria bacterium]NNC96783.1 histidine kinase [Gammaproteobacteria bacterium]NNM14960.1 histidine kinase [Gammaproteobacteria bacterium]
MSSSSDNPSEPGEYQTTDGYFLPDLTRPQAVLGMLLSIELIVAALALMKYPVGSDEFLNFFGGLSFLMLWIGVVFALVISSIKNWLMPMKVIHSTIIQLVCLVAIVTLITYLAKVLMQRYLDYTDIAKLLETKSLQFYLNNILLSLMVGGLLLRYFYIAHQNEQRIKAVSAAQVQALQSRIRPHFLFNSLNSIASLITIDPVLAEQSVEDLSDLFRASLSDSSRKVSLKEELEIARLYQRIEQLRLGDRLQVNWSLGDLPLRQKVPVLIIQPLLENAIYHGIEPLTRGGAVDIQAEVLTHGMKKHISISILNPLDESINPEIIGSGRKHGNQIALKNIEQRLRLVYGDDASVTVTKTKSDYQVVLRFPFEKEY